MLFKYLIAVPTMHVRQPVLEVLGIDECVSHSVLAFYCRQSNHTMRWITSRVILRVISYVVRSGEQTEDVGTFLISSWML